MENTETNFTDETVVAFTNMIRSIINKEVRAILHELNTEQFSDLRVVSVSSDSLSADLEDMVTGEVYQDVPNHTGIRLHRKDIVRMYRSKNGEYIGLTFGDRTDGLYKDYVDSEISKIKNIKEK